MAGPKVSQPSSAPTSKPSYIDSAISTTRRKSSISVDISIRSSRSSSIQSTPSNSSPRVQLIPHIHRLSYDSSLPQTERDILDSTSFDTLDLSSKDFDFEDIFLYDKPQGKRTPVVEASTTPREKDWSNFSFSHYASASAMRQKVNRSRSGTVDMYIRNQADARKR